MPLLPDGHPAKAFASLWDRLSLLPMPTCALILLDGHRIIPPISYRRNILRSLHASHASQSKCFNWAISLYHWPGMKSDIMNTIHDCTACTKFRRAHNTTSGPTHLPSDTATPMNSLSLDYFKFAARTFIIMADRFSGLFWIHEVKNESTASLIRWLVSQFHTFGWPQFIRTDGGPQFRSDFQEFCAIHNIVHELSSAYNPHSNGHAEAGVKSAKFILKRCIEINEDPASALSRHMHAPRADGYSPFQLFFGRAGRLPDLPTLPKDIDVHEGISMRDEQQIRQSAHFRKHARELPPLRVGDRVLFQDSAGSWTRRGIISHCRPGGLSYYLTEDGSRSSFLRGRRLLRRIDNRQISRPPDTTQTSSPPPPRRSARLARP